MNGLPGIDKAIADGLTAAYRLGVETERERCAVIADTEAVNARKYPGTDNGAAEAAALCIAEEIRNPK